MKNIRWYDKNPDLKHIFEIIKNMDEGKQRVIAQDIIQILISVLKLNLDEEINKIGSTNIYDYRRWYDNDINLFTSFEIMKNVPDNIQQDIAKKIAESMLLVYAGEI